MTAPDPRRSRILLAGTAHYRNRQLPDLDPVTRNLESLHHVLTDPQICGFDERHCQVVDGAAVPDGFLGPLARAAQEATDLLFVYYAGHGLLYGSTGDLHLAMTESDPDHPWTSASFEHAARLIMESEARTKILILDCCYGGRAMRHLMAGAATVAVDQVDVEGVLVMTSTSENKRALAPRGARYTLFTAELVDVLTNGVPSAERQLTALAVFEAVRARMRTAPGVPVPQIRARNTAGNVVLALNRWRPGDTDQSSAGAEEHIPAATTVLDEMMIGVARRNQSTILRQLEHLDALERQETDPDTLSRLFQLDQLITLMRRDQEGLLILAGVRTRQHSRPQPLTDVLRAAAAEIEYYQRLAIHPVMDVRLVGNAVIELVRLLAELFDNATAFSPPETMVAVQSFFTAQRDLTITIEDRGIGMSPDELAAAEKLLATPTAIDQRVLNRRGLPVVARLASYHGVRVQLTGNAHGGITASVTVPRRLTSIPG